MTSLTTAGGLLSFAAAELAPIADFGIFGPVGVIVALAFTLVLIPALTAVFPMGTGNAAEAATGDRFSQRLLVRTGEFANTHAPSISLATAGLIAIALLGAFQIRFEHDPIAWFPEDDYFRISSQIVDDELRVPCSWRYSSTPTKRTESRTRSCSQQWTKSGARLRPTSTRTCGSGRRSRSSTSSRKRTRR